MGTATLQQNDLPPAPLRPGKGESNEKHRRYRQDALVFYQLALKAGMKLLAAVAYVGVSRTLLQKVLGTGIGTVQVDGGGEFLGGFVRACEELGVKRMVNPPYNSKCGAHIESFNGGFRRECLNGLPRASTAGTIRAAPAAYTDFYNAKRCHSALGGLSPIMALKRLPPQSRQKRNM